MSIVYIPPTSGANTGDFVTETELSATLQRYALQTQVADKIGTAGGTITGELTVVETFTNPAAISGGTPEAYLYVVVDTSDTETKGQYSSIAGGSGGTGTVTSITSADSNIVTDPSDGIVTAGTIALASDVAITNSLTTQTVLCSKVGQLTGTNVVSMAAGYSSNDQCVIKVGGVTSGDAPVTITVKNAGSLDQTTLNLVSLNGASNTGASLRYQHAGTLSGNSAGQLELGTAGTPWAIVGPGTSTFTKTNKLYAPTNGHIDAYSFGIVYGDSSTDYTTQMQAAITACQSSGQTLVLSGNVFLNNATPLSITGAISIIGTGRWGGAITQQSLTSGIMVIDTPASYKLYNLAIQHVSPATSGIQIQVLTQSSNPSSFFNIGNVIFQNSFTALQLANHYNGVITECYFNAPNNTNTIGINIVATSNFNFGDTTIMNCLFENWDYAIRQETNMGLRIRNNKIAACTHSYYLSYTQASGGDFFFSENSLEGGGGLVFNCSNNDLPFGTVMIVNNEISVTTNQDVITFSPSGTGDPWVLGLTIVGNQIGIATTDPLQAPIQLSGITNYSISGNTFTNTGTTAVPIYIIDNECSRGNIELNNSTSGSGGFIASTLSGLTTTQNVVCLTGSNGATGLPFYDSNGYLTTTNQFAITGGNTLNCFGTLFVDAPLQHYIGQTLRVGQGTNQRAGLATLVAGIATVANTGVTTSTLVLLGSFTGNAGNITYTVASGVGFTLTSTNLTDASPVAYFLIEAGN